MSKSNQHHIKAIIYDKRGRILSIGENSYHRTHRVQYSVSRAVGKPNAIYIHGEIDAIVKCREIHNAHKILVMRITPMVIEWPNHVMVAWKVLLRSPR